jgi:hypothetical protein
MPMGVATPCKNTQRSSVTRVWRNLERCRHWIFALCVSQIPCDNENWRTDNK